MGQYYDDQLVTQSSAGSPKVLTQVILNGYDGSRLQGKPKDTSCKQTETRTETGNDTTDVNNCNSRVLKKTMDNKILPQIVDVYSLNSVKTNMKTTGIVGFQEFSLNEGDRYKFPLNHGETAKRVIQDRNLCSPSSVKKSPQPDKIIDLTIDEEGEEQISVDKESNDMNENISKSILDDPSKHDELKEKIDTADNEEDNAAKTERSQNKHKDRGRKRKRRCQTTYRESLSKYGAEGCDSERTLCNSCNNSKVDNRNQDGSVQKLWDKSNNSSSSKDEMSQITEDRNQTLSSIGVVNDASSVLDSTYRANKITTLKARLAKQEEELARLRTQKERLHVQSNHKTLDTRGKWFSSLADSCAKTDMEQKQNFKTVSVDDICQHVLKSFDIFNARRFRNRKKEKAAPQSPNNTCVVKQDGNDICFQTEQDEFLSRVGLKRRCIKRN